VLELLISTAGGRFHFITVQGRHLFKETIFNSVYFAAGMA